MAERFAEVINAELKGLVEAGADFIQIDEPARGNVSGEEMARQFRTADKQNHARLEPKDQGRYQQFFFKVRDDVDLPVEDFYVDFHVVGPDGRPHEELTLRFDEDFEANFYRHSASSPPACGRQTPSSSSRSPASATCLTYAIR